MIESEIPIIGGVPRTAVKVLMEYWSRVKNSIPQAMATSYQIPISQLAAHFANESAIYERIVD